MWATRFGCKPIVSPVCLKTFNGPGGDEGARTPDIRLAKAALSQLSYIPSFAAGKVVGLTGFEPVTPVLSGLCSNQLSYRPSQLEP